MSLAGDLMKLGVNPDLMIRSVYKRFTAAQIKALRATPQTLVAAPGTGRYIHLVDGAMKLKAGTNVLTESADNLAVKFDSGSGVVIATIETTSFITAAADTTTNIVPNGDIIVAASACLNKKLVLHNTGDGEIAGNAAADALLFVWLNYRVINMLVS